MEDEWLVLRARIDRDLRSIGTAGCGIRVPSLPGNNLRCDAGEGGGNLCLARVDTGVVGFDIVEDIVGLDRG